MTDDITTLSPEFREAVLRVLETAKERGSHSFAPVDRDHDVYAYPRDDGQYAVGINGRNGNFFRQVMQ